MTLAKVLLLLLACVASGSSQWKKPKITQISADQLVDIGDTAQLYCTVENGEAYPVYWFKENSSNPERPIMISVSGSLKIQDTRFSLRYDAANSTYNVKIRDVQDTDGATYQCKVIISPLEWAAREVKLQVREPPVFLDNSTRSVVSLEGQSVKLECYAKGCPPPQITWRRENNFRLPSGAFIYRGNILQIDNITKKYRGLYYCVAENGVGKPIKRGVEVHVEFSPIVTINKPRTGQALRYDADLECTVESHPYSSIYWLKNDTVLPVYNSSKYMVAQFSTSEGFVSSVLRIREVDSRDYGTYQCKASNKMGVSYGSLELFETVDPICPPACSVRPMTDILGTTNTTLQKK